MKILFVFLFVFLSLNSFAFSKEKPSQNKMVKLLVDSQVYSAPDFHSRKVEVISASAPISSSPTFLPVLKEKKGWFYVLLPGRPNFRKGWINENGLLSFSSFWKVKVSLKKKQAKVYFNDKLKKVFVVQVGKKISPTPKGLFYVMEVVRQPSEVVSVYGPWVLTLNGYSDVYKSFAGGPGQIALHGAFNKSSSGSFGCVRFKNKDIVWLSEKVVSGSLVSIF